jgi:hypothetical protein
MLGHGPNLRSAQPRGGPYGPITLPDAPCNGMHEYNPSSPPKVRRHALPPGSHPGRPLFLHGRDRRPGAVAGRSGGGAVNRRCGSAGIGNTGFAIMPILNGMSPISIGTRSSTAWSGSRNNGRIRVSGSGTMGRTIGNIDPAGRCDTGLPGGDGDPA